MERIPRQLRHMAINRSLVIAGATALALAILAAAGIAATNRASVAPSNTTVPTISGTTQVGSALTTSNGTWNGTTPLSYAYQWRRCDASGGNCSDISGATANSYTLTSADQGNTVRAVVTAKNTDGSDNATTVPTAVVTAATAPPSNTGCPDQKTGTVPIASISLPAQLQIVGFTVPTGPINRNTQTFTLQVRVGTTCGGVTVQGASVYATAVPYNQFDVPAEVLTGSDGTASLNFHRAANFPASSKQQQLTFFIRATKPGEDILAGVGARRLVAINFGK
jgi:hypothetical protein